MIASNLGALRARMFVRAEIAAATAELARCQRRLVSWFASASLAFLAGLLAPGTQASAALFTVALLGYVLTMFAARRRNSASDRLVAYRSEAERLG